MNTPKSQSTNSADPKASLRQLEELLDTYLVKKAPFVLPSGIKEAIVNFSPWISLVVLIVALPALLAFLGIGAVFMPFSYLGGLRYGFTYTISMILTAIAVVIEAIAIPGLFKRAKSAWYLMYYAALINIVHSLISFDLGGMIIGGLISLYILFQVKEYYK